MKLSPAELVHRLLGVRPLARWLQLDPSTVQRWLPSPPRGHGGLVPAKHHAAILEFARRRRVRLIRRELKEGR